MAFRELILNTSYPVRREVLNPRQISPRGGGIFQVRNLWHRNYYRFYVTAKFLLRGELDAFMGFVNLHKGTRAFQWSGLEWGFVGNPTVFAEGNGSQTQFFLPNRFVYEGSLFLYLNGVETPAQSVNWGSGLVTLSSPPGVDVLISAKYQCYYKVIFDYEGEAIYSEEQTYLNLGDIVNVSMREVYP